jgi:hypothetical protein
MTTCTRVAGSKVIPTTVARALIVTTLILAACLLGAQSGNAVGISDSSDSQSAPASSTSVAGSIAVEGKWVVDSAAPVSFNKLDDAGNLVTGTHYVLKPDRTGAPADLRPASCTIDILLSYPYVQYAQARADATVKVSGCGLGYYWWHHLYRGTSLMDTNRPYTANNSQVTDTRRWLCDSIQVSVLWHNDVPTYDQTKAGYIYCG